MRSHSTGDRGYSKVKKILARQGVKLWARCPPGTESIDSIPIIPCKGGCISHHGGVVFFTSFFYSFVFSSITRHLFLNAAHFLNRGGGGGDTAHLFWVIVDFSFQKE